MRAMLGLIGACLSAWTICSCAGSARATETARVDGTEFLSFGWYSSISNEGIPDRLAASGFDFVMPYVGRDQADEVQVFLDAAARAGVRVALEIPRGLVRDSGGEGFREYVLRYAASEAVASWYLYDEPEWKLESSPARLKKAYARLKELDPGRPVALVFMFPFLVDRYAPAMDELWFDKYPIAARGREFSAFANGKFADSMISIGKRADRLGKTRRIVLQGFGEGKDGKPQFWRRLPTRAETRYMLYASLLAKPAGLLYWTLYRSAPAWVESVLQPELDELRSFLLDGVGYSSAKEFTMRGARCSSIVIADGEGRSWLLLVGRGSRAGRLRIEAPTGIRFEDGSVHKEIELPPYGVELVGLMPQAQ